MNIGIVSGKGGTGKTLVATNLAYLASGKRHVRLVDLDVEEPNDHLFFALNKVHEESAKVMVPRVNDILCNSCGKCSEVCQFNAIINIGADTFVFPELCHSCYACQELCPTKAIRESFRQIGKINSFILNNLHVIEGRLNVGELSAPFLIKQVKEKIDDEYGLNLFDCPPGNACSLVEAISDTDYVIIVAEPTLFGLHDFKAITQTLYLLGKEFGVIINKHTSENNMIKDYCIKESINVIGVIPFSFNIAEDYAKGELASRNDSKLKIIFENVLTHLETLNKEFAA